MLLHCARERERERPGGGQGRTAALVHAKRSRRTQRKLGLRRTQHNRLRHDSAIEACARRDAEAAEVAAAAAAQARGVAPHGRPSQHAISHQQRIRPPPLLRCPALRRFTPRHRSIQLTSYENYANVVRARSKPSKALVDALVGAGRRTNGVPTPRPTHRQSPRQCSGQRASARKGKIK